MKRQLEKRILAGRCELPYDIYAKLAAKQSQEDAKARNLIVKFNKQINNRRDEKKEKIRKEFFKDAMKEIMAPHFTHDGVSLKTELGYTSWDLTNIKASMVASKIIKIFEAEEDERGKQMDPVETSMRSIDTIVKRLADTRAKRKTAIRRNDKNQVAEYSRSVNQLLSELTQRTEGPMGDAFNDAVNRRGKNPEDMAYAIKVIAEMPEVLKMLYKEGVLTITFKPVAIPHGSVAALTKNIDLIIDINRMKNSGRSAIKAIGEATATIKVPVHEDDWDPEEEDEPEPEIYNFIHPHIDSCGSICWGTAKEAVEGAVGRCEITTIAEAFRKMLPVYNENSPHCKIEHWELLEREEQCEGCGKMLKTPDFKECAITETRRCTQYCLTEDLFNPGIWAKNTYFKSIRGISSSSQYMGPTNYLNRFSNSQIRIKYHKMMNSDPDCCEIYETYHIPAEVWERIKDHMLPRYCSQEELEQRLQAQNTTTPEEAEPATPPAVETPF